jgi:hypothetical protein
MQPEPGCPQCGKTDTEPGPRPGMLRCLTCNALLRLIRGRLQFWLNIETAGRRTQKTKRRRTHRSAPK